MKTPEAIEFLKLILKDPFNFYSDDDKLAISIAIGALERHRNRHQLSYAGLLAPLPGETPDADSP